MANQCSCNNCELEIYEDSDKCVLHCEKDNIYRHTEHYSFYETLKHYLRTKNRENVIVLNHIVFPPHDDRDSFDYEKILREFTSIYFNYCEFHTSNLELQRNKTKCFFQDCKFHNYWTVYDYEILINKDNILYQACIFNEDVSPYSLEKIGEEILYTSSQFDYTSRFEKELRFDNVKFKKPLFYSAQNNYLVDKNFIKVLTFNNCIFEQPFKLNNYEIDYFTCNDTVFKNKSKFEFKNNEIGSFSISNTNFNALVDCHKTKFKLFFIEKSIFKKFTGFEQCEFGERKTKEKNIAIFQYATFLDFVNFREAIFYNGLDLQNANLKEYPNFLGIEIEPSIIKNKITNRETFRIIKHSFDSVGNTIEANKFFAYEMDKERKSISLWDEADKKIILTFNYLVSNFGQSFLLPLFWILVVAGIHFYIVDMKHPWLESFAPNDPVLKKKLLDILQGFDNFAKNILPFKKFLKEGMEFISLIFLIIYSTLIYNFIVAVKRITKR